MRLREDMEEKFKTELLVALLEKEQPKQTIVFCRTKIRTEKIYRRLEKLMDGVQCIHGDLSQSIRNRTMQNFRQRKFKILVATDVMGRGIDVSGISHIINYDLPELSDDYVHRVGRTGRAGVQGRAISFACENSAFELPSIEEYIGHSLTCTTPEEEMLVEHEKVREAPQKKPQQQSGGNRNNRNRNNRHRNNRNHGRNNHNRN